MRPKAQVYIVDDDDAVRDSLSFQLETAGYQATGFSSGIDFLRVAPTLGTGCLILDVRMPEIDGMDLQSRLNDMKLGLPVIMMTGHGDVALAVRAMKAGAIDFVEKPFSEEAILESIGLALSRTRCAGLENRETDVAMARLAALSCREREVMEGLVAGQPNKMIAFELGLSPRTIEVHRSRIMDKTQARSVPELVRLALAAGVQIRA
jgi:two-component system, LuxR family, response regulator FixJ